MSIDIKEHLITVFDFPTAEEAISIANKIKGHVKYAKIGKQLFTAAGPDIVKKLNSLGLEIFLDLKFHDIPNTVSTAGVEAAKLNVKMFNLHISGGLKMMQQTVEKVEDFCSNNKLKKPIILGVTVLTSLSDEDLKVLGYSRNTKEQVLHLAKLAKHAGLDGVVASAKETEMIKAECGDDFVIVTPGIRPTWAAADDQKRVITPRDAIENGSDYIVVGRPIMKAPNPVEAISKLLD